MFTFDLLSSKMDVSGEFLHQKLAALSSFDQLDMRGGVENDQRQIS